MESLTVLPAAPGLRWFGACGAWASRRYRTEPGYCFEALLCRSEATVADECRRWLEGKAAGERVLAFARKSRRVHLFVQLRDGAMLSCRLRAARFRAGKVDHATGERLHEVWDSQGSVDFAREVAADPRFLPFDRKLGPYSVEPTDDGALLLRVQDGRRFQIELQLPRKAPPRWRVTDLADRPRGTPSAADAADRLRGSVQLYPLSERYEALLARLVGPAAPEGGRPRPLRAAPGSGSSSSRLPSRSVPPLALPLPMRAGGSARVVPSLCLEALGRPEAPIGGAAELGALAAGAAASSRCARRHHLSGAKDAASGRTSASGSAKVSTRSSSGDEEFPGRIGAAPSPRTSRSGGGEGLSFLDALAERISRLQALGRRRPSAAPPAATGGSPVGPAPQGPVESAAEGQLRGLARWAGAAAALADVHRLRLGAGRDPLGGKTERIQGTPPAARRRGAKRAAAAVDRARLAAACAVERPSPAAKAATEASAALLEALGSGDAGAARAPLRRLLALAVADPQTPALHALRLPELLAGQLRAFPWARDGPRGGSPRRSARGGSALRRGEAVDGLAPARNGRERWFPAEVVAVRADGTYDVRFQDGEEAAAVPRSRLRRTKSRAKRRRGRADEPKRAGRASRKGRRASRAARAAADQETPRSPAARALIARPTLREEPPERTSERGGRTEDFPPAARANRMGGEDGAPPRPTAKVTPAASLPPDRTAVAAAAGAEDAEGAEGAEGAEDSDGIFDIVPALETAAAQGAPSRSGLAVPRIDTEKSQRVGQSPDAVGGASLSASPFGDAAGGPADGPAGGPAGEPAGGSTSPGMGPGRSLGLHADLEASALAAALLAHLALRRGRHGACGLDEALDARCGAAGALRHALGATRGLAAAAAAAAGALPAHHDAALGLLALCGRAKEGSWAQEGLGPRLGAGRFGAVEAAARGRCVKRVRGSVGGALREVLALSRLPRGAGPRLHRFGPAGGGGFAIEMERCDGGTLLEWRSAQGRRLRGRAALRLCVALWQQTAACLARAAGAGVAHLDLKADNVMLVAPLGCSSRDPAGGESAQDPPAPALPPAAVRVCDWGEARVGVGTVGGAGGALSGRARGTEAVSSPEMLLCAAAASGGPALERVRSRAGGAQLVALAGTAADAWALGCLLFELLAGEMLFRPADDFSRFFVTITDAARAMPLPPPERVEEAAGHLPEAVRRIFVRLMAAALVRDPDRRPSARDLQLLAEEALASPAWAQLAP